MDTRKLEKLKAQIDDAKETKAKAEGALEPLMVKLNKEFDCKTLEEAEVKLKKLGVKIESMTEEFDEKLREVEKLMAS